MNIVTCAQMKEADRLTSQQVGIPEIVLMENAAIRSMGEIIKDCGDVYNKNIMVFAGYGNNGGDALALARHLFIKGANVKVKLVPSLSGQMSANTTTNLTAARNMTVDVDTINNGNLGELGGQLKHMDIVVDGIFGTGLNKEVSEMTGNVMDLINSYGKMVYALDIPSGINGDTGQILGKCVKAAKTLTFGLPKVGLYLYPGSQYCGEIVVMDIGIPQSIFGQLNVQLQLTELQDIKIPRRYNESSKMTYGKVLLIGGSTGMAGSVTLASLAALKSGAGLVYLGAPHMLQSILSSKLTEVIVLPLEDDSKGVLSVDSLQTIKDNYKKASAIAVGPGLSQSPGVDAVVKWLIENSPVPLVLDADALNSVSKDAAILKRAKSRIIITPHAGEMARLINATPDFVQNNRLEIARKFSKEFNVITILKGSSTIIAEPSGKDYINSIGNNGMATAGSGDVLTGIIAGLIAQDLSPEDAAATAVYLHGTAGDSVATDKGVHGMTAGDIVSQLPYTIKEMANKLGIQNT